jgi:hypothetical protein
MAVSGQSVVDYGKTFVGEIPYKLGSSGLDLTQVSSNPTLKKFVADCSLFVQNVFKQAGVSLPRNAASQYKQTQGQSVPVANIQPGDLLFYGGFNTPDNPPGYGGVQHVAIYAGNGQILQEGGVSNNVEVASFKDYQPYLIAATRPSLASANPTSSFTQVINTPVGATGTNAGGGAISAGSGIDLNPLDAIGALGNTFSDIAVFLGVVFLALVLIIGGVMLLKPQSA